MEIDFETRKLQVTVNKCTEKTRQYYIVKLINKESYLDRFFKNTPKVSYNFRRRLKKAELKREVKD